MIELKFKDGRKLDVVYPIKLTDSSGNIVYYEGRQNGYWSKHEYDSNGMEISRENSDGHWIKREYDDDSNETYYEDSGDLWIKREFDINGMEISREDSLGFWQKSEYSDAGDETYYEDSNGTIKGVSKHTVVEMTMEEICKAIGKNVKVIK